MIEERRKRKKMEYKCTTCGVEGVKLWREYNIFLSHQTLECVDCACKSQDKDASLVDEDGMRPCNSGLVTTDQIGWRVPACPTENGTFWGYTSVPQKDVLKWKSLPLRKKE